MITKVSFPSAGLEIAAELYKPEISNGRTLIVGHPGSSVKEQSPALYASKLVDDGFLVLTFDAAYQGESEGLPRSLEDPDQRIEDFKAAVSYLSTRQEVDANRLGVLGICASGGYVISAAAGDRRIKAVATVAATDVGLQMRVGADGKQDPAVLDALLNAAGSERTKSFDVGKIGEFPIFPASEEEARAGSRHVFEGWEYYCSSRGCHDRSAKMLTWDSLDRMATFDAFRFIDMISPRPILMVTSEHAVTAWMTREALAKAREPKALYVVKGATHVDLYDQEDAVNDAVEQISIFFNSSL